MNKPRDVSQRGFDVLQQVTGQAPIKRSPPTREKNPHAVALGQLGASKGGRARAASLSAKKRKAIARKAAAARWGKYKKPA